MANKLIVSYFIAKSDLIYSSQELFGVLQYLTRFYAKIHFT